LVPQKYIQHGTDSGPSMKDYYRSNVQSELERLSLGNTSHDGDPVIYGSILFQGHRSQDTYTNKLKMLGTLHRNQIKHNYNNKTNRIVDKGRFQ